MEPRSEPPTWLPPLPPAEGYPATAGPATAEPPPPHPAPRRHPVPGPPPGRPPRPPAEGSPATAGRATAEPPPRRDGGLKRRLGPIAVAAAVALKFLAKLKAILFLLPKLKLLT